MWQIFLKQGIQEVRPYAPGEDLSGISVNYGEIPEAGGMIARDSENHKSQWYISKEFFERNYCEPRECSCKGAQFVRHIAKHLGGQPVVCKICGKTVDEIANQPVQPITENSVDTKHPDDEGQCVCPAGVGICGFGNPDTNECNYHQLKG